MSQRQQAGGRRGDLPGWSPSRVLLAAGLLVLVAVGLRVNAHAPAFDGPFRHDGLLIGAILEAVLAGLLAALAVRNARAPRDALLAARLRRMLTYVVGTGLVAIPTVYLLGRHAHLTRLPRPPRVARGPGGVPRPGHPGGHPGGYTAGWVLVIILGVLVAAALIYAVARLASMRHGFWAGWRGHAVGTVVERPPEDDEAGLREAVESGQVALRRLDDARTAIIACYVAMEQSLARAGTARAAADTPDELLARAAGRGLVTGKAAARLTALFYEARFSSHPMPPVARTAAEWHLSELAASLDDAGAARAAAGPGGADERAGPA